MRLSKGIPLALLLTSAPLSHAAEVTINGFLSTGIGLADVDTNPNVDPDVTENNSFFGYNDDISFDTESVFGFQIDAELDENISLTGQVVGRGVEDYATQIEWAFFSYRISDALTARAGRLRIPFYMYSDFLEVGYAYPWITPPRVSYTLSPFSGYDGVDFIHTASFGDWYSLIQAYWGNNNDEEFVPAFDEFLQFDITNILGIAWTMSTDALSVRFGYHYLSENTVTGPTPDGLAALIGGTRDAFVPGNVGLGLDYLNTGFNELVDAVEFIKDSQEVLTIGVEIDWEGFLFITEYINFNPDLGGFRETTTTYFTAGYRFDDALLLHYTYEQADFESNVSSLNNLISFQDDDAASAPAVIAATIAGTQDFIKGALDGNKQFSHAVGVRYDLSASVAIKAEIQYNDTDFRQFSRDASNNEVFSVENITSFLYTIGFDLVF